MLRANGLVAVLVFAALTAVVALQVVNRLVLHLPLIWSEEAARFLFFWVVMLGAAMSVRRRRHFVLDLSMGRAQGAPGTWPRLALAVLPHACIAGFSLFLLVESVPYVDAGRLRTATNSGVNMALVYAAIPVFAALSLLYSTANLTADVRAFRNARSSAQAVTPGAR